MAKKGEKNQTDLAPRNQPRQARSIQRSGDILEATARLLEQVGFDDLTTILIARELNISVGTLYHYFPNKHAIMHAIAEQWLLEYTSALNDIEEWKLEGMSIKRFCAQCVDLLFDVYNRQRGILPLVGAISVVPELAELDQTHDKEMQLRLARIYRRLSIKGNKNEFARLGLLFLEINHAVLMVALEQTGVQRKRTLENACEMNAVLLQRAKQ